jgi:hypothetical protein
MRRMETTNWLVEHWVEVLQTVGIVGGLCFTVYAIRKDGQARQIENMMGMAHHHYSIWKEIYHRPQLLHVMDKKVIVEQSPVTPEEQLFVTAIIIHLDSVHRARKAKLILNQEGLREDIHRFFSLPIPQAVWREVKQLHDQDFVAFVEAAIRAE